MFDGGTRVPFIIRWPARITPGESDAILSHVDFYASFAALAGQKLPERAAPDSLDVLEALLGESEQGRHELVVEGTKAKTVLRQENWVFIGPHPGPEINKNTNTETGNSPEPQLYDLAEDLGQIRNLALEHGKMTKQMAARLNEIVCSRHTR